MPTCYIIDDDIHAIEAVAKYIVKIPNLTLIGSNINPLVALEEIWNGQKPDIVFLDVEMPELSGIELADLLDPSIAIVFTTSHSKYAMKAFQKDAFDFLLKPFSFEMFLRCLNKVKNRIYLSKDSKPATHSTKIFINTNIKGKIVQIDLLDITHIEAMAHAVRVHLSAESIVTNLSIKKILEKLPEEQFIRVHRTFIASRYQIKTIETNQIMLKNGINIPIGNAYRNALLSKIKI